MFKPMPNFKTTIPFIVNLQVYEHSAKLLACIHVIQCMIEYYFTYNWIIYKYTHGERLQYFIWIQW